MTPNPETPSRGVPASLTCLVVEDDPAFAAMASQVVREAGGEVTACGTVAAAQAAVATRTFDVVLLDNHLPDGRGYRFFEELSRRDPELPILMITGAPDLAEAVSLTRNGLFDYLTKPVSAAELAACLGRARLRCGSRRDAMVAMEFLGEAPAVREVRDQLDQAARHPASTVLLTGETGTGKEVAARYLHQRSYPNSGAPFVAVNCAAVPAEMFESELFGAERGAYTGADKRRSGLAAAAAGGTLFLDEIAEVPLALQAKLLRLLEAREFRALGSTETQGFTGRFVAATHRVLEAEVRAGRFREDLMYRLDVWALELPPLRQRRSDIPMLGEWLLTQLALKYGRPGPLVRPEDLAALQAHDYPGNVRELRNVLERSLLRTPSGQRWLMLDAKWLQRRAAAAPARPSPGLGAPVTRDLTPVEMQEYQLIRETLRENQGGIRRSAAKLGLSPQSLLRRLEKWPELRVN